MSECGAVPWLCGWPGTVPVEADGGQISRREGSMGRTQRLDLRPAVCT